MAMLAMMSPQDSDAGVALFTFLACSSVALFGFLAVAVWTGARQKEREAYYKAEMMKKIAEMGGERNAALDYLREQERFSAGKRVAGFKLGGLVNIALGVGVMIMLHGLASRSAVYLTGVIPLLLGVALVVYGYWMVPKVGAVG